MASIRVRRVPGAPVVAVRVWLPGGSTAETLPGQALVSGRLLLEGTLTRSWRRIAEEADRRGMAILADAGYEAQGVAVEALADDWELALEWAAELTLKSVFPEDRCRWIARQAAAELEQLEDHPDVKTSWAFSRQLYGETARGRPLQGSVESLEKLDGGSCRRFHASCLERGAIVTVAGDIHEDPVRDRVRDLFDGVPTPARSRRGSLPAPGKAPARQHLHLEDSEQAHWFGGAVTVDRRDPDYWALGLIGVVLGAGGNLSGRISHRVREVEGLAYGCSIATVAGAGLEAGCLSVAVGTSPERVAVVEAAVTQELEALIGEGVREDELADARAHILGRQPFGRETARQWATLLAQADLFGVAIDDSAWVAERWREVTGERILEVARRYLDPGRLEVTVGSTTV